MNYLRKDQPLLVLIGPSAAGKSSVAKALAQAGLISLTPSWTTRPARPEEQAGSLDHRLVSPEEFATADRSGHFLETVQLFGLEHRYGLPRLEQATRGIPAILLRANLIDLLAKYYSNFRIYQVEDQFDRAKARLDQRRQPLGTRQSDFFAEVAAGRKIADRVFSNNSTIAKLTAEMKLALAADFIAEHKKVDIIGLPNYAI